MSENSMCTTTQQEQKQKKSLLSEIPQAALDWMVKAHQNSPHHEPMYGVLAQRSFTR